ncbi:MAG: ABC transporter ATP-binding protein [Sphaerochaetaceae bacterium]|jgi:putative ABC transport system ATP-binding protein|nr:ABC transporter ATP-binding protein [Sphaerochaetaceae bacterium]
MEESLIKLENVWKIYKLGETELSILKGINLEIKKGIFATIMGPSGSGKSTLMYMLGLLDTPSKGKIYLQGKDTSNFSEDKLATFRGKKIGFIFQQFNLLQNLTALENVMLPMVFQGIPEDERRQKAKKLLISVNLAKRIDHKPSEMSGGEQQRIAIARSLVNDPEILIGDEPTGNLDSSTGKSVMEILTQLHEEQKKTIIIVTHDPNIAQYSQNVIHIQDGQIEKNHFKEKDILWAKNGNIS